MSSRAFERQEGESSKAYRAFGVFRDLGPDRSLAKTAELVYGSTANVRQLSRWSARFSWRERAQSYDDWTAMIAHEAIERHLEAQAEDHAKREAALREKALKLREMAASQAELMLGWPLREERVVHRNEDGTPVEITFHPVGWSKATAVALFNLAFGAHAPAEPEEEPWEEGEIDFSHMTDEEVETLLELDDKARQGARKPPPDRDPRGRR